MNKANDDPISQQESSEVPSSLLKPRLTPLKVDVCIHDCRNTSRTSVKRSALFDLDCPCKPLSHFPRYGLGFRPIPIDNDGDIDDADTDELLANLPAQEEILELEATKAFSFDRSSPNTVVLPIHDDDDDDDVNCDIKDDRADMLTTPLPPTSKRRSLSPPPLQRAPKKTCYCPMDGGSSSIVGAGASSDMIPARLFLPLF